MTHDLRWFLARGAAMAPAELAWRAASALSTPLLDRWGRTGSPVSFDSAPSRETILSLAEAEADAVLSAAERIAEGELSFWGRRVNVDPYRPDWHTDPLTGERWDAAWRGSGRDPKPVWELNHLHHLVPLAAGAALGDRPDWARIAVSQTVHWVENNPRGTGIAWASGYEAAHRLVAWTLALPLVVEHADHDQRRRLETAFAEHRAFVAARPSRFSSANNHRLVELVALLAASILTPGLSGWDRLWAELSREARRQTYGDGGSREQAAGYFLYALEILWLGTVLARAAGRDPSDVEARLATMLAWLAAVADDDNEPPPFGDDAEDRIVRLDYFEPRRAAAIVARLTRLGLSQPAGTKSSVLLSESGYAIFRAGEARIAFDVGELGFGALAAHGHADALSVLVDAGGRCLLRDSGTGSYIHGRDEDRATAFHNTVVVDGKSQAHALGPHLWGGRFAVRIEAAILTQDLDYARASHDGYLPVRHTRCVIRIGDALLIVLDRITADDPTRVDLVWQRGPALNKSSLNVASDPPATHKELSGRFSPRYTWTQDSPRSVWSTAGTELVFASAVSLLGEPLEEIRLQRIDEAAVVEVTGLRVREDWSSGAPGVDEAAR